ncbi:IS30 family transposase [Arthrobacter sp. 1088]|uniref:IS30 family transposase n=1 Tax=Arthrobacter sp. 1088 TaxID=2817768 RepID=UPI00285B8528|nr:IS30 family transposase [Arthrobacter sp. 1088]MDR6685738.1 IS30 family transposase [Arthrobacter sp. 1088]
MNVPNNNWDYVSINTSYFHDVLARDTAGDLWVYPGDGLGGWKKPRFKMVLSIRPMPSGSARLLRSGKFSRRPRSRTKVKSRQYITDALKNGDRPAHIAGREEVGHWEGDLIMGKANRSAIVTLVERTSRFLIAFTLRPESRSENMRDQLIEALAALPASMRRTLTWDRGSEMAKHAEVTSALGIQVCTSVIQPAHGNVH